MTPNNETAKTTQEQKEFTSDVQLRATFQLSVEEGKARMDRSWASLLATGFVGGMDVSLGVLAMELIQAATGSRLLGALGFSIGFIALTLGRSELFTENFLLPVAAVLTRRSSWAALMRLWLGTAVTNLLAAWFVAWLISIGLPQLAPSLVANGQPYVDHEIGRAFVLGILGGMTITFMTWVEHGAETEIGRLIAVASLAFLLAAGHLNHVVVTSAELFGAILTGDAPYGYAEWARVAGLATLANMTGGLLLVTTLRLAQVGFSEVRAERRRPARARTRKPTGAHAKT